MFTTLKKASLMLYDSEVKEFFEMYDSGKYYLKEIIEWFGISYSDARKIIANRSKYIKKGLL